MPDGVSVSTISPTLWPKSDFPTGDSSEIFPSIGFASMEPTILYSRTSPYSTSFNLTLLPISIISLLNSLESTIFTSLSIASICAILASTIACSFFASSYSLFSERSPNEIAVFIFDATSLRVFVFNSSNSFSNFFKPSEVNIVCLFILTLHLLQKIFNHI